MQLEDNTLASNDEKAFIQSIQEAKEFANLREYFSILHKNNINYVVLRNWENLPNSVDLGEHSDLDLLVDVNNLAKFFFVTQPIYRSRQVIINQVIQPVSKSYVKVDVRTNRDNYLPHILADQILKTKTLSKENECYIPGNNVYLFCSLLYHAAFQKPKISDEYMQKLLKIAPVDFDKTKISDRNYIRDYFANRKYELVRPYDPYVFWIYQEMDDIIPPCHHH